MTIPQFVKYSVVGQQSLEIVRYHFLSILLPKLDLVQDINSQRCCTHSTRISVDTFPQDTHQGHLSNRSE